MNLNEIVVKSITGEEVSMDKYVGKVLMVVNTATGCGFTPQYEGLQALYEKYHDQGFEILDFPCNQFANQAPESNEEIVTFCKGRFGITFPQFAKIDVNGDDQSELYTWLKSQKKGVGGSKIKWNFTKFIIDRQGNVIGRYAPTTKPEDLEKIVLKVL